MKVIIIPLTNKKFVVAFHGLYLPAAHSYSFRLLFSFWVEHMERGLWTMSNKRSYKNIYYIEHNMTVHLLQTKGNACIHYFPIVHNALCLLPKFCINHCCEILLGGLHISKSIP